MLSTGDGQSKPVISDTFRTGGYKSNHFDGPARHSLYGTMAAMHENEAPPAVPATIDDLVCAFDSAYPTLDSQLGPKVRMRKQKIKGNPTREVPNFATGGSTCIRSCRPATKPSSATASRWRRSKSPRLPPLGRRYLRTRRMLGHASNSALVRCM